MNKEVGLGYVEFGDLYKVYPDGRIWKEEHFTTRKDGVTRKWKSKWQKCRIRKDKKTGDRNGYVYTDLIVDGEHMTHMVHRVVAMCFIPNPENLPEVNHIDGDKTNNSVDNLEWVTSTGNKIHAYKYLREDLADKHFNGVVTPEQAIEIFNRRNFGREPLKELAEEFGIGFQRISAIAKGDHSSTKHLKEQAVDFSCDLSKEQIDNIIRLSQSGIRAKDAIEQAGVSKSTYYRIIKLYSPLG